MASGCGRGQGLHGKTVLIIEDEFMIAMEYALELEGLGAKVVGPVASVPQALNAIRERHVDAAIVDIDLEGTKSFAVADALLERRVPFVFATGYDDATIPERFSNVVRIAKPAVAADLVQAVLRATEG